MKKKSKSFLLILFYLILIFLPVLVFFFFEMPARREFWRDFSVMLGFVGFSMAGMQFIPTTRLKILANVFDLDKVYKTHHFLSVLSVLLILVHPLILVLDNPNVLLLFNPFTAPWRAQAGWIGLAGFLLIAITSIYRNELRIDYNVWHVLHLLFTILIMVFGLVHIFKVNYYASSIPMRIAWIIEVFVWCIMIITFRVIKPARIKKKPFAVKQVITELPDTWTMVLEPVNHAGMQFKAGQVAWISINSSPYTLHRNPFSFSGSSEKPSELRFTIAGLGDFSSSVGKLKGGEIVYIDGPYGSFSLDDEETKTGLVLIAGGIGVAPVFSILKSLEDRKDQRPVYLFYGNYDEESIIFYSAIEKMKKSLNLKVIHVLEKPQGKISCESGFITRSLLEKSLPADKSGLYFFQCGPLPMIKAIKGYLHQIDIHADQVRSEEYEMA